MASDISPIRLAGDASSSAYGPRSPVHGADVVVRHLTHQASRQGQLVASEPFVTCAETDNHRTIVLMAAADGIAS